MARPLRLEFPGAIYHLKSRGNARAKVFYDYGHQAGSIRENNQAAIAVGKSACLNRNAAAMTR
jgi:hypothetical protein